MGTRRLGGEEEETSTEGVSPLRGDMYQQRFPFLVITIIAAPIGSVAVSVRRCDREQLMDLPHDGRARRIKAADEEELLRSICAEEAVRG